MVFAEQAEHEDDHEEDAAEEQGVGEEGVGALELAHESFDGGLGGGGGGCAGVWRGLGGGLERWLRCGGVCVGGLCGVV